MKYEFSAGGIVYKKSKKQKAKSKNAVEILVCQHSQHHGWVFPKGLIGDHIENESKEETAVREVEEETGIAAQILKSLEPVTYWYQFEGEKIKKSVYYFLMEFVSGDTKNHDNEMENVEWVSLDKVEQKLTYESDKIVWRKAKEQLATSHQELIANN